MGQKNTLRQCFSTTECRRGHQLSSHFLLRSSVWGNPVHNKSSRGRKRKRRRPVFSTEQNVNTRSPFPIIIIIVCSVVCSSEERLSQTLPPLQPANQPSSKKTKQFLQNFNSRRRMSFWQIPAKNKYIWRCSANENIKKLFLDRVHAVSRNQAHLPEEDYR